MKNLTLVWLIWMWLVLAWCSWGSTAKPTWDGTPQVCNEAKCFKVDLADTVETQKTGLMNVEEMAPDAGMLFVFDNPWVHRFWMKNTLIPLDMIWIADSWEVLYIKEYAPPCTPEDSANDDCQLFWPPDGTQAKYVLEVNANSTREYGIYEGIVVDLYNVK